MGGGRRGGIKKRRREVHRKDLLTKAASIKEEKSFPRKGKTAVGGAERRGKRHAQTVRKAMMSRRGKRNRREGEVVISGGIGGGGNPKGLTFSERVLSS